jgi:hypothetical protein
MLTMMIMGVVVVMMNFNCDDDHDDHDAINRNQIKQIIELIINN